jgi:hypothetical protein
VGDGEALDATVDHEVDRGPVGHLGHGEARDLRERGLMVERRGELLGGARDERPSRLLGPRRRLGLSSRADVREDRDDRRDAAVGAAQRVGLHVPPALRGRRAHAEEHLAFDLLAEAEREAAGQFFEGQGPPLFVEHVEDSRGLGGGHPREGRDRVAPEEARGGLVGVEKLAPDRLHGDPALDAVEDAAETFERDLFGGGRVGGVVRHHVARGGMRAQATKE